MAEETYLLIRGGTVVTAEYMMEADILVRGEKIQAIGKDLTAPDGAEIIDARDMIVLPGVIDAHTHTQLDTGIYQTDDDWFISSRAAAYGGVTTVVDFATQFKGQKFPEATEQRLQEAAPSVIDYAFHMMVTDLPPGREEELCTLTALGIQSIKLYTTYRPNYYADDATLLRLLKSAARHGMMTLIHCENDALVTAQTQALIKAGHTSWRYHGQSRPALAEQEAAARVLFLAEAAHAPVVIAHNSTAQTSLLVAEARERGQIAFCETAPQYLLLDNTRYAGEEPWRYILQPPLRDPDEKEALWTLVSAGIVDMLITDHCDYAKEKKLAQDDFTKTAGGLPGMELLLPLIATYGVNEGRLEWTDVARLLAKNPASIYNMWPRKGDLLPGGDADIIVYHPRKESIVTAEALHTVGGYSPYEGMKIVGKVVHNIRRGQFLVRAGKFVGERGSGQYIKREPSFWD